MPSDRERNLIRSKLEAELSDDDIDVLLGQMQRIEGGVGTTILERDTASDTLFFLVEGTMVAHVDADGRKLVLGHVEPGQWIGELQFIERGRSSATVTSETPFVALCLKGAEVDSLIEAHPLLASVLIRALSREIAERLARTSAGVLERVTDESYQVANAEQKQGWFRELLGNLFGKGGDAA